MVKIRWTRTICQANCAENADKTILFRSLLRLVYDYASTNFEFHGRFQRARVFLEYCAAVKKKAHFYFSNWGVKIGSDLADLFTDEVSRSQKGSERKRKEAKGSENGGIKKIFRFWLTGEKMPAL